MQEPFSDVQEPVIPARQSAVSKNNAAEPGDAEALNRQSQRIQQLIEEIDSMPDAYARGMMQECVQEILSFYGHGLKKMLSIIARGKNDAAKNIYNDLIEDSFVTGLLLIHDLHPLDLKTRLYAALEKVKPYMDSHGGSVEIVSVADGIAKLKLSGSCKGCPSSASTLELGIKQAIEEHCPDLLELEVEGITAPENNHTINGKEKQASKGWQIIADVQHLRNGEMKPVDTPGTPVVVCKVNGKLYAYHNNCPACNLPLNTGNLENHIISCKLGHHYDIQKAGKCTDDEALHLSPFPLIEENGVLKIATGQK